MAAVIGAWPQHERFLRNSLSDYGSQELAMVDDLARRITVLAGDRMAEVVQSYRWMCGELTKETLYFKKHDAYRLSTFADADRLVYSNRPYMKQYMEGLLCSQALWRNHSAAFLFFRTNFLSRLREGFSYLEVGPGHGLFLSVAAEQQACAQARGWDVSEESLRQTALALEALGSAHGVALEQRDVLASAAVDGELFDGIAVSEVLEHLEQPREALVSLRRRLAPEGLIFINVPLNSPAPDHIYLLRTAQDARALVEAAGLEVVDLQLAPMTGYSVAEAERQKATVSCLIIAK
ncbi:bifunctional 2-polyprenyl-6-hydroxyphenol methylase/3-demethylubiquinol 3-O-methyltransferase UbiG [Phenylobacterium sp. Root700]|uniref:class I SAM-dependent methyltransferase n=1 Tax=Phenylobacterium sp. Root700 TaxID=1736591 RepID=UPI0007003C34|nr:methyltransferase domain-containing protein [Phenylobacterium sp. Root700]KRB41981.1 hypothetical protein ASE02_03985 [Phenylobacterium sp. Root700]